MEPVQAWRMILSDLEHNPRDFDTVPSNGREPRWFFAKVEDERVVVETAKYHVPSSKLSSGRKIYYEDFMTVYNYYGRWSNGETFLRQEIRQKSRNTAYIFSLIQHII